MFTGKTLYLKQIAFIRFHFFCFSEEIPPPNSLIDWSQPVADIDRQFTTSTVSTNKKSISLREP